jgi:hypothetical protein
VPQGLPSQSPCQCFENLSGTDGHTVTVTVTGRRHPGLRVSDSDLTAGTAVSGPGPGRRAAAAVVPRLAAKLLGSGGGLGRSRAARKEGLTLRDLIERRKTLQCHGMEHPKSAPSLEAPAGACRRLRAAWHRSDL